MVEIGKLPSSNTRKRENLRQKAERGNKMSEEATSTQTTEEKPHEETGFTPITTQAEFDAMFNKRWGREKAKYEGFDEYKSAAEKLKQIEEANQSELEKMQKRAEKAEAENAAFKQKEQVKAWAAEVSEELGVPAEALRGSTKEELEAHAKTLQSVFKAASAPVVKSDGKSPAQTAGASSRDQFYNVLDDIL